MKAAFNDGPNELLFFGEGEDQPQASGRHRIGHSGYPYACAVWATRRGLNARSQASCRHITLVILLNHVPNSLNSLPLFLPKVTPFNYLQGKYSVLLARQTSHRASPDRRTLPERHGTFFH